METLNLHRPSSSKKKNQAKQLLAVAGVVAALTSSGNIHAQQNPDPVILSVTTEVSNVTRPVQDMVRKILDSYGNELMLLGGTGALVLGIRRFRNRRKEEDSDTSFLESDLMPEYFDGIDEKKNGADKK